MSVIIGVLCGTLITVAEMVEAKQENRKLLNVAAATVLVFSVMMLAAHVLFEMSRWLLGSDVWAVVPTVFLMRKGWNVARIEDVGIRKIEG